jgi:hypothetical protein
MDRWVWAAADRTGSGGTDEDGTENCGERDVAQAGISGMHVKGNSNRSH